jgi:hypothetical protein
MSPNGHFGRAFHNVYTVLLGAAFAVVFATAIFVAVECYLQYGKIFQIPSSIGY